MASEGETAALATKAEGEAATASTRPVVIVCVDQSKQARACVDYYFDHIYKREHDLVLLHILELPIAPGQVYMTPNALEMMWAEEKVKSSHLEAEYNQLLKEKGVGATFRAANGYKPGEVIVDVANELKATMIVMGTRGMGVIRRTIMGSVSDYVVHHSPCAVVVCRFADDKHHHSKDKH